MKRFMTIILAIVLLVSPFGSLAELLGSHDEQGNFCSLLTRDEYGNQYTVSPESFPYCFKYIDKEIAVVLCDFYQAKIGYGYYPFCHIRLDVSKLSDDEVYWLRKEDDSYFAFLTQKDDTKNHTLLYVLVNVFWTDVRLIDIVLYNDTPHSLPQVRAGNAKQPLCLPKMRRYD